MILDLVLKFSDEKGNDYIYQYGTEILKANKKKAEYKHIQLSSKEILALKDVLNNQLMSLLPTEAKE